MKKKSLIFIIVFFAIIVCQAQNERFFTTDNNLSSSLINSIYQDKQGYIWISTSNGLNKFDGTKFESFHYDETVPNSPASFYFNQTIEDDYSRIWVCHNIGIDIYDRDTETFSHPTFKIDGARIYPFVQCILKSSKGEIWIGTNGDGIAIAQQKSLAKEISINQKMTKDIGDLFITSLFEDSEKKIWIATANKGIFIYNQQNKQLSHLTSNSGEEYKACGIAEDHNGNIFIITPMNKVYIKRKNDKNISLIPLSPLLTGIYKMMTIIHDKVLNQILIGTDGQGLLTYNYKNNRITTSQLNTTFFDITNRKIHALLRDRDNNLWIGLYQKGIFLQSNTKIGFEYYGYNSVHRNGIGVFALLSIFVDNDGSIWAGTDNDGIYIIDQKGNCLKHYSNKTVRNSNLPISIECILKDSKGRIWIGSYQEGLGYIENDKYIRVDIPNMPKELSVYSMVEDKKQQLWIGTRESGVIRLNLNNGTRTIFKTVNSCSLNPPYNSINTLMVDKDDNIFVGTTLGIGIYNSRMNMFLKYNSKRLILPDHDNITAFLTDKEEYLWIATSLGVYKTKGNKIIKRYTTQDGLPSNNICGIQEDEHGNIWLSTHQGICKFNKRNHQFYNYNIYDGLQGNEFVCNSFKAKDGRIYFPGISGITAFFGKDIHDKKEKNEIYFTNLYVNGIHCFKNSKSNNIVVLKKNIQDTDEIYLSYKDSHFSLSFSTFEFVNPQKNQFEYRLAETNNNWIRKNNNENYIQFSSLPSGNYTLELRVVNKEHNSPIKRLIIHILPPWYRTTWAYILYLIAALVAFYFIRKNKQKSDHQKSLILEQKRKEQENENRFQFFINISHEMRSPITLVTSPLEKLISDGEGPQKTYQIMMRNAQKVLKLLNQLLDIRKIDKGYMNLYFQEVDIEAFIKEALIPFSHIIETKNIGLKINRKDDNLIKLWIDTNQFDKIISNIVSNALKYTPHEGKLEINISRTKNQELSFCQIDFIDTGIGISNESIDKIFDRFYQINNFQNQSDFGTGIGLHLCKLLVELHHGNIYVQNRDDGTSGSRFIIKIPLGKKHLKDSEIINEKEYTHKNKITDIKFEQGGEITTVSNIEYVNKPNILIVEDEIDMKLYLCSILEKQYNMYTASNGEEGVQKLNDHKIDLIISDVLMAQMDGFTFCKQVKSDNRTNDIPFILLSGQSTTESKIKGLNIGADAYIEKPFNTSILISTITSLIKNRKIVKNKIKSEKVISENESKTINKSSDELLLERIVKNINENLSNSDYNVEILAKNVGISRAHLYRKLKEMTNESVIELINEIRLKKAETLLRSKNFSISEVAYTVGFKNVNYFSTLFKERYHNTPKEYRNMKNAKGPE